MIPLNTECLIIKKISVKILIILKNKQFIAHLNAKTLTLTIKRQNQTPLSKQKENVHNLLTGWSQMDFKRPARVGVRKFLKLRYFDKIYIFFYPTFFQPL